MHRATGLTYIKSSTRWQHIVRVIAYTFALVLLQAEWVSVLPKPAMRVDLILPLMFGIAVEWPPVLSVLWAVVWGYVMDTLSGKFWGLHVGTYVFAVCLVKITAEKFEFHNPAYQMIFVGLCALGQSLMLGLYLLFEPSGPLVVAVNLHNLVLRSLLMTILSPVVIYPIWSNK